MADIGSFRANLRKGVESGHRFPLLFRGGAASLGPATPGLVAAGWWPPASRKAASPPQPPPLKRRGLQCPLPLVLSHSGTKPCSLTARGRWRCRTGEGKAPPHERSYSTQLSSP